MRFFHLMLFGALIGLTVASAVRLGDAVSRGMNGIHVAGK